MSNATEECSPSIKVNPKILETHKVKVVDGRLVLLLALMVYFSSFVEMLLVRIVYQMIVVHLVLARPD